MAGIYCLKPCKDRWLNQVAVWLADCRITANQITWTGWLIGLISAFLFWRGYGVAGLTFLLISLFADLLDGAVARVSGSASLFGKYLDAICDRTIEISWVGVLVILARIPWWGWVMPLGSVVLLLFRVYAFRRETDTSFVIFARFERMAAILAISVLPWHEVTYPLYLFVSCAMFVSAFQIVRQCHVKPKLDALKPCQTDSAF